MTRPRTSSCARASGGPPRQPARRVPMSSALASAAEQRAARKRQAWFGACGRSTGVADRHRRPVSFLVLFFSLPFLVVLKHQRLGDADGVQLQGPDRNSSTAR